MASVGVCVFSLLRCMSFSSISLRFLFVFFVNLLIIFPFFRWLWQRLSNKNTEKKKNCCLWNSICEYYLSSWSKHTYPRGFIPFISHNVWTGMNQFQLKLRTKLYTKKTFHPRNVSSLKIVKFFSTYFWTISLTQNVLSIRKISYKETLNEEPTKIE